MSRASPRLLFVCGLLATSHAAFAQISDDALVERGIALRRERKDSEALEAFRRAQELRPSARTRAQIALAEQALSDWVNAEKDLVEAMNASTDPWIEKNRKLLERALTETVQHLGSLEVDTNVEGAELWIDHARVGVLPMGSLRLAARTVLVELRAKGYESVERSLNVPAKGTALLHVVLAPPKPTDSTPENEPPALVTQAAPAPLVGSTPRTVAWALLAGGAVLVAEAATAQVVREVLIRRYNDDSRCYYGDRTRSERCGNDKAVADAAQTFAWVGFAAGGLAVASSAYLFLVPGRRDRGAESRVVWSAGPRSAFVGWQTEF